MGQAPSEGQKGKEPNSFLENYRSGEWSASPTFGDAAHLKRMESRYGKDLVERVLANPAYSDTRLYGVESKEWGEPSINMDPFAVEAAKTGHSWVWASGRSGFSVDEGSWSENGDVNSVEDAQRFADTTFHDSETVFYLNADTGAIQFLRGNPVNAPKALKIALGFISRQRAINAAVEAGLNPGENELRSVMADIRAQLKREGRTSYSPDETLADVEVSQRKVLLDPSRFKSSADQWDSVLPAVDDPRFSGAVRRLTRKTQKLVASKVPRRGKTGENLAAAA
jgi:hypothetical protein